MLRRNWKLRRGLRSATFLLFWFSRYAGSSSYIPFMETVRLWSAAPGFQDLCAAGLAERQR